MTAAQERQVFRWVNGKTSLQYGFDFGLWNRQILRTLLAQRFDVLLEPGIQWGVAGEQGRDLFL